MAYCILQIMRWRVSPQFIDIYYHLMTAGGFIQAGGYSGWDFWQYAPVGRVHIYPPFFHLILASFIKLGINKIIIAKFFETIAPVLCLSVLWYFVKRNYTDRLAFLVLLTGGSSFSFYLSLINYLPATLAIILGLLAFDQLLKNRFFRSTLLFALCFYTHIGVSWFFHLSVIFYGLFNKRCRKLSFLVFISSVILSMPILLKHLIALKFISIFGISNENYFCEFKPFDYLFSLFALFLILKMSEKYRLFLSLFLASFIFLAYPYRFFSAQGFLPIIFLSAFLFDFLYEKFKDKKLSFKYLTYFVLIYFIFISPTISMERSDLINNAIAGNKQKEDKRMTYNIYLMDSAFINIIFPRQNQRIASISMWFPIHYLSAAKVIKDHSEKNDIIYASLYNIGTCIASLSDRATANRLFPEIKASIKFDPLEVSKIFIALKDDDPLLLNSIIDKYDLIKIGENKLFIFFKNPLCNYKVQIRKASVPFWVIGIIALVFILIFLQAKKIEGFVLRKNQSSKCGS